MGKQYAEGLTELDITKAKALEYHLQGNFYPPHPRSVVMISLMLSKNFGRTEERENTKLLLNN